MVGQRLRVGEGDVVQPWRGVAIGVRHQFHQQHAVVKVVRCRHPHTGRSQAVQRVNLGTLPGGLLLLAAKLAALGHGAG